MLKAFKMPFLRNGNKPLRRTETRRAGLDEYRAMVQRFKAMLQKIHPVDVNAFESSELRELERDGLLTRKQVQEMEAVREGYAKNGQALWDYARAVTKELPEPERHAEMEEIKELLERAGSGSRGTQRNHDELLRLSR
jgi:DNA-binding HxlR family transcriptional regulator